MQKGVRKVHEALCAATYLASHSFPDFSRKQRYAVTRKSCCDCRQPRRGVKDRFVLVRTASELAIQKRLSALYQNAARFGGCDFILLSPSSDSWTRRPRRVKMEGIQPFSTRRGRRVHVNGSPHALTDYTSTPIQCARYPTCSQSGSAIVRVAGL